MSKIFSFTKYTYDNSSDNNDKNSIEYTLMSDKTGTWESCRELCWYGPGGCSNSSSNNQPFTWKGVKKQAQEGEGPQQLMIEVTFVKKPKEGEPQTSIPVGVPELIEAQPFALGRELKGSSNISQPGSLRSGPEFKHTGDGAALLKILEADTA